MSFLVLVVDDDKGIRYLLRECLEAAGLCVEEAGDGATAFARIQLGGIDLVLSDLRMPGMDGRELLEALSAEPDAPPVVMITGDYSNDLAATLMALGARACLPKPFDGRDLVRVVMANLNLFPPIRRRRAA